MIANFFQFGVAQKWRGRIRAHAAGIQARVAVERALVILRSGEQFCRFTVTERVQRNFDAFEKFLDDNFRARRAETFADKDFINRFFSLGNTRAN